MNRLLLSLLRTYVERETQWEEHLQLLLYIYRTTKHSSTGFSPFEVLFGFNPPLQQVPDLCRPLFPEPSDYCEQLKNKLAFLREMVDSNLVESTDRQQNSYKGSFHSPLEPGQRVLLNNPCANKLEPCWTGPWLIRETQEPLTVTLTKGDVERTVRINHVRPLLTEDLDSNGLKTDWTPLLFHHYEIIEITESDSPDDHFSAHNCNSDDKPHEETLHPQY